MTEAPKQRLNSLDVFRGITLSLMVLVNTPGDPRYVYQPLDHARWHGWTPTDLVFPFFLFIVGVAIPFAFANRIARGESRRNLYIQILRRTALLFLVGLALNGFPNYDLSTIRIMGILQRIALCYLATAILYLKSRPRTQAVIGAALLVVYFAILKFVPAPAAGIPTLERDGNWVQYFDTHILGNHLQFPGWEGKGLLSTLPAIANCLLGLLAGEYLRSPRQPLEKVAGLYTAGLGAIFLGAVWSLWFPINQNLWTSSLVLFMGGMALAILAACYYTIDIRKRTWWTKPFVIFGLNSLAIWVGSSLFDRVLDMLSVRAAANAWLASWAGPYNGSLLFALGYVLFWLGVMAVFYRRGVFLKL
jgi:predicted acyltransferase